MIAADEAIVGLLADLKEAEDRMAEAKDSGAVLDGLKALDAAIIKANGGTGEPGSGIFTLLSELANQFMGVPRQAPPAKEKEPEKEPEKKEPEKNEPPKPAQATATHGGAPTPGVRK